MEERRKQQPSHYLWKLTDILNLARISETQGNKAAEGDRGNPDRCSQQSRDGAGTAPHAKRPVLLR